jgi:hypothetical protein
MMIEGLRPRDPILNIENVLVSTERIHRVYYVYMQRAHMKLIANNKDL